MKYGTMPIEQVRQEKLRIVLDEQLQKDFMKLLDSKEGRRFFWNFIGQCRVFSNSFTGSSETFFLEGQRNAGLAILSLIPLDMLSRMEKEYQASLIEAREIANNLSEESED